MTCRSGAALEPVVQSPQQLSADSFEVLMIRNEHSAGFAHGVIQIPRPNVIPIAAMAAEKTGTVSR
jgi:hypothetical protein